MARVAAVVRGNDTKEITLQQLERNPGNSVFVLNSSPRTHRGEIIFSVPRPNGVGEDIVRVPKTWVPVDLTDQVEKKNLLESTRFRQNISKKLLTLVHPDYAEKVLNSESAQVERERLDNLRSASTALMRAAPTTAKDEEEEDENETPTTRRRKANLNRMEESNEPGESPLPSSVGSVTAKFDLLLRNLSKKRSQDVILNALRNEGALTRKELNKVVAMFGSMPRVVRWAERKLEG